MVRPDLVEDLIWQQISELIQKPEIVRRALEDKFDACHEAQRIADLAQARHRLEQLKEAERRLLVQYADPANNYSQEALDGAVADIIKDKELVQKWIEGLEQAMVSEDEKRRKLADVQTILNILKHRLQSVTFDVKRQVVRNLVSEIRVGKSDEGTPTLKIIYAFSKDWIEEPSAVQLHSSRVPVRNVITTLEREVVLATDK